MFVDADADGNPDGTELIIGISGNLTGSAFLGQIIISEFARSNEDAAGEPVGISNLILDPINSDTSDPFFETNLGDMDLEEAHDVLLVSKDITVSNPACAQFYAGSDTCEIANTLPATVSIIVQDFKQIQIPEPATLGLFGIGLAGLGFMMRRRRKTAA